MLATAGEAPQPESRTWTRELRVEARGAEIVRAVEIPPGSSLVHLGLLDSGLAVHEVRLVAELTRNVDASTLLREVYFRRVTIRSVAATSATPISVRNIISPGVAPLRIAEMTLNATARASSPDIMSRTGLSLCLTR